MIKLSDSEVKINLEGDQKLSGKNIVCSRKYMRELKKTFKDVDAFKQSDQEQIVYEVQAYMPVGEDTPGGLFFGNSLIYPGKVGDEYFMTRGHLHHIRDTAEYYWCIYGKGALIFMDVNRNCWCEIMTPGSLHYIPGNVAHRVANIGDDNLFFNACWYSNAGHDYDSLEDDGFSARLLDINGTPTLVSE